MKRYLSVWCAGLLAMSAFGDSNWPQFRGPNASAIGTDGEPPIHFGPSSNVLWQLGRLNGVVTVIQASDELKVLAQNRFGEAISATPAIVEGKLYLRTATQFFSFGHAPSRQTSLP